MNTHHYNAAHTCTCQHHHLLNPGTVCEVCMGTVPENAAAAKTMQPSSSEVFDEAYFEALESFYEDITFAA